MDSEVIEKIERLIGHFDLANGGFQGSVLLPAIACEAAAAFDGAPGFDVMAWAIIEAAVRVFDAHYRDAHDLAIDQAREWLRDNLPLGDLRWGRNFDLGFDEVARDWAAYRESP
jgi:hypothetical protein